LWLLLQHGHESVPDLHVCGGGRRSRWLCDGHVSGWVAWECVRLLLLLLLVVVIVVVLQRLQLQLLRLLHWYDVLLDPHVTRVHVGRGCPHAYPRRGAHGRGCHARLHSRQRICRQHSRPCGKQLAQRRTLLQQRCVPDRSKHLKNAVSGSIGGGYLARVAVAPLQRYGALLQHR
jgi:hypothetical protein